MVRAVSGCGSLARYDVDAPGHEFADARDGVLGDAAEDVAQVGFRVGAVELRRLDQIAAVHSPPWSEPANGALGGRCSSSPAGRPVARLPKRARVADRRRALALAPELRQRRAEEAGELVDERPRLLAPDPLPLLWRQAVHFAIGPEEAADPHGRLIGEPVAAWSFSPPYSFRQRSVCLPRDAGFRWTALPEPFST